MLCSIISDTYVFHGARIHVSWRVHDVIVRVQDIIVPYEYTRHGVCMMSWCAHWQSRIKLDDVCICHLSVFFMIDVLCSTLFNFTVLCCAELCCALRCSAVPCSIVLRSAALCHDVLCCALSYQVLTYVFHVPECHSMCRMPWCACVTRRQDRTKHDNAIICQLSVHAFCKISDLMCCAVL